MMSSSMTKERSVHWTLAAITRHSCGGWSPFSRPATADEMGRLCQFRETRDFGGPPTTIDWWDFEVWCAS